MFQSLDRAYKRSDLDFDFLDNQGVIVSIPRSGLQAFRRQQQQSTAASDAMFQSLDRAYKRSDRSSRSGIEDEHNGFNPSIGLTSVPTQTDLV